MNDAGFWIEESVIAERECTSLTQDLFQETKGSRAGTRHLMANPAVFSLAHDQRLLRLAKRALGHSAVPFRATLFEKSGRANWLVVWHQDTALPLVSYNESPEWGPWSKKAGIIYAHAPAQALSRVVALRVHLDASTSENGPLRVIPGSHVSGVLSDEDVFCIAREQEHVDCHVSRGGVLAMRPLLIHSSSKAHMNSPRRVLHIEYSDSLDVGEEAHLAVA